MLDSYLSLIDDLVKGEDAEVKVAVGSVVHLQWESICRMIPPLQGFSYFIYLIPFTCSITWSTKGLLSELVTTKKWIGTELRRDQRYNFNNFYLAPRFKEITFYK